MQIGSYYLSELIIIPSNHELLLIVKFILNPLFIVVKHSLTGPCVTRGPTSRTWSGHKLHGYHKSHLDPLKYSSEIGLMVNKEIVNKRTKQPY